MEKFTVLIVLSILIIGARAQDYNIDFTASGASNTLDSIHVINLDQQTELTLLGTDTLHLVKSGIGIETVQSNSLGIKFFPNPLQEGKGTLSFYLARSGQTRIEIFDIEGKKLLSENIFLQSGKNDFHCSGMPSGFFMVNVTSNSYSESVKLISINGQRGIPRLEFVQSTSSKTQKTAIKSSKSVKSIIGMQYNDGEKLKFTAYSDSLTSVDIIIPNKTQTLNFNFVSGQYPSGTVHCISGGAAVVDVTNPTTGETWMDRNLGASQQATSSTDSQAYGDLYQWGRFSDGHQCRNSIETTTQSSSDTPGHGDFIKGSSDWRSPQNNNLWQGVYGTNNPCPSGYRLPTKNELNTERQTWSSNNTFGAYGSPLKLPVAGYRYFSSGSLYSVGSFGYYWSSTVDGSDAYFLYFYSGIASMYSNNRASGNSVRCLKDGSLQPPSINTHPSGQTINDGGNASFGVSATGGSLTYQWQESTDGGTSWNTLSNGGVYSNVTADTMNITSATLSMDSYKYRCVVSGSVSPAATSNAATLTVTSTTSSYPSGTVHCISGGAAVIYVTNPTTGETWMDRNLGASQQATSSTDSQAYGDLYQWGRFSDGHQCRNSSTTSTNATTATPNNGNPWDGKFITEGSSPYDWLSSQNNNLWQGVNGTNNPCPSGYRLPTKNELNSERQSWSPNNAAGAYGSPLKLPVAGRRFSSGSLSYVGSFGYYWSSTVDGSDAYFLRFYSGIAYMYSNNRAYGRSVRCLKDVSVKPPSINTHPSGQTINDGGNASFGVSATGGSLTYQWQESTDGGTSWNTLSNGGVYSNVTADTMNITSATLSMDSYKYRCVVSGSVSPAATSNAATLTVTSTSTGSYPSGTVHCISGGAAVVDVTNPTTGETWMDRNLGASRQATSSTDSQAYGDLYQWGRFSDGHQCRNSSTTSTNASTATPNNGNPWDGKFITEGSSPFDWLSSQNNNLWQGVNGTNNPCPSGYRLPTKNELNSELQSWSSNNAAGAYGSPLNLPVAGRCFSSGSLSYVGSFGFYWSSTVDGSFAYYLYFFSGIAYMNSSSRADGYSVRCLKD